MSFKVATAAVVALAGAGVVAQSQLARAEELQPAAPPAVGTARRQLAIYDAAQAPTPLLPTLSPLQNHVRQARETAQTYQDLVQSHAQLGARKWIGWEGQVERKIKALVPNDESLTPGLLYVGVATLAGSILARNRNVLLRLASPPVFFFASLGYFLPGTARNVAAYAELVEKEQLPSLRALRTRLVSAMPGAGGR